MTTWAMAHPILTFILIIAALVVLEESVANICKAIIQSRKKETEESGNEQTAGK